MADASTQSNEPTAEGPAAQQPEDAPQAQPERLRPSELKNQAVRRVSAAGASRRPSAAAEASQRPSAAGKRRSRTSTRNKKVAVIGSAVSEDAPKDAEEPKPKTKTKGTSRKRAAEASAERVDRPMEEARRITAERNERADWHTDSSNPYLSEDVEGPNDEDWFEDDPVYQAIPVRDIGPQKHRTSTKQRNRAIMAVFGVVLAVGALALFVWFTRTVQFRVNGEDASARYGTTLDDYIADSGRTFTAGNLVSVGGNVLAEGGGNAYAATVNGEPYSPEEAKSLRLVGGETIELGNGLDLTEDHDVEVVTAPPLLEFDGSAGAISFVSQWGTPGAREQWTGKLSGEVALADFVTQPTNTIVTTMNITPSDDRKLVALTFDDGPSDYTPLYLDILERYGAKATFFMFGPSAEADPEMARRVVEAGHQVCNHTSQHQDLSAMDAEQLHNELLTTFQQVDDATGTATTVFRPPWAIFGQEGWLKSGGAASASVLYNADSNDWDQPGVDSIVRFALDGVASGSIILMHDGGYRLDQDLEALPRIISYLQGEGYELVTLSELLASDPAVPEQAVSCDDPMPEGSVWPTEILAAEE